MRYAVKVLITSCMFCLFFFCFSVTTQADTYATLSNGTYYLSSAMADSLVMDITGMQNGNYVVIWNMNYGENQQFILNNTGNGWYRITNRGADKVLDLAQTGAVEKESRLVLNDYTGKDSQLFRFYEAGNGYYYLQNKSGYYLDVHGGSAEPGGEIQAFPKLDQYNQMWKLTSADEDYETNVTGQFYFQTCLNSSLVMDITNYGGEGTVYPDGNNIVIWNKNEGRNQRFNIIPDRENWYRIINESTGKAVTVNGGKGICGEDIATYSYNGADSQVWRFYNAGNGYYYVKNKLGYYLDVYNGDGSGGAKLVSWRLNKGNNQKWMLVNTTKPTNVSEDNIRTNSFDPIWPLERSHTITTLYYYSSGSRHSTRYRYGIDMSAPKGENVLAVENGKVIGSEYSTSSGFGNWVRIRHDNGKVSLYAHLNTRNVSVGQQVERGQVIGTVGNTSAKYSVGYHLHFELGNSDTSGASGDPWQEYFKPKYGGEVILTQAAAKYPYPTK